MKDEAVGTYIHILFCFYVNYVRVDIVRSFTGSRQPSLAAKMSCGAVLAKDRTSNVFSLVIYIYTHILSIGPSRLISASISKENRKKIELIYILLSL